MRKSFLAGAGILAASVILAKVLGAVYRIPLANIIGAEGMGVYQFVYPIFALLLTLSSGAMPTAISIEVSKHLSNNDEDGARRVLAISLKLCLIIGIVGTALLIILAYPLSLLQSKSAFIGYLAISPAVFIVTIISVFRGWFMGHKDMVPTSISQITEGVVKLAVGITLTKLLLPRGINFAVAGALIGVVASELVTLVILLIIFFRKDKRFIKVKLRDEKVQIKHLSRIALPLIACGMILPISQFIDSVLLVNLLKLGGESLSSATANYGVWSGAVTPLINLPIMVCITLGIAITPQMVEGREKRDVDFIMDKCATATKLTFILGIPFVFIFVFMSKGIIGLLFPTLGPEKIALGGQLLQISAISVLGLSLFQIYSAMLQGLGKTYVPLLIMAICVGIKTALSLVLVPMMGIIGGVISLAVAYIIAGIAILVYFFNYVRKSDDLLKNASLITLCGVIMGLVIMMSDKLQTSQTSVIIVAVVSLVVYAIGLFVLQVFSKEELRSMPFGHFLLRIDNKINGANK